MVETLAQLTDDERYRVYQSLIDGCKHIYSKGKLQENRLAPVLEILINLAEHDPVFLAHLTSYIIENTQDKDLKVLTVFANSLSDADGTPFSPGSKYSKPNLRMVSWAAINKLDPKLVLRVLEIAKQKRELGTWRIEGSHLSKGLRKAVKRYLRYREYNIKGMEGIRRVGFAETVKKLYRTVQIAPSNEAASILGWKQKDGRNIDKKNFFSFKGLSSIEIAEKIRSEKLSPTGVLGALPGKLEPVIAAAILEQASGNQAVILREQFDSQGILKHKEVMDVFEKKIKTASTALDRVDKINTEVDEEVSKVLKKARSEKRKEDVGDIGKVYVHIDISSSMQSAVEFAKERGAIIAECVNNPEENFYWGLFNDKGYKVSLPETFEKDAFAAALYGVRAGGMTDCLACYEDSRKNGCDVDVFITDQGHNGGPITQRIEKYENEGLGKPKAVIIIDFSNRGKQGDLYQRFANYGIPTTIMKLSALTESALVVQAVKEAMIGPLAVIDNIMNTPLLKLPHWWNAVDAK